MSVAFPKSMEEWLYRQLAQKNEERKNKTESQSNLRNFRGTGMNEADTRLSSIRQEEREKKKMAEELNRNYRRSQITSAADEVDTKLKDLKEQERKSKKLVEEMNRGYRMEAEALISSSNSKNEKRSDDVDLIPDVVAASSKQKKDPLDGIALGSVSGLAANFNSVIPPTNSQDSQEGTEATEIESISSDTPDKNVATIEPEMLEPPKESFNNLVDKYNKNNGMDELTTGTTITKTTTGDPFLGLEQQDNQTENQKVLTEQSPVISKGVQEAIATHDIIQTEGSSPDGVATNHIIKEDEYNVLDTAHTSASLMTPPPPQPKSNNTKVVDDDKQKYKHEPEQGLTVANGHDQHVPVPVAPVRLDISFSFGLIAMNSQPLFTGYIAAVEEVLKITLSGFSKTKVSYNRQHHPLVLSVTKDDTFVDVAGRSNIQRMLVQISLPIFFSNDNDNGILQHEEQMMVRNKIFQALHNLHNSTLVNASSVNIPKLVAWKECCQWLKCQEKAEHLFVKKTAPL